MGAMIATTVFLFAEASTVVGHWKTSVHVGGLVTLVAAAHYMYMREYWVAVKASPIVYRYIDWTITVPLQMIEFNLIIKAAGGKIGAAGFWKLLIGTVFMLAFGFFGRSTRTSHPCARWASASACAAGHSFSSRSLWASPRRHAPRTLTSSRPLD